MKCYVFDLDGTLANCEHRLHFIQGEAKDWASFFAACKDDEPILPLCTLYETIWFSSEADGQYACVIVSGRSDECREQTMSWIKTYLYEPSALYMRKAGDHRPDHIVKAELLTHMLFDGWEPILFIDDRKQVVDMWRAQGYICLQAAPGDF